MRSRKGLGISQIGLKIVDIIKRTQQVAEYRALMESQWLPYKALKDLQFHRIRELLLHAGQHVPYYRDLFRRIGFRPQEFSDLSQIEQIPVMTKSDVRENADALMASNARRFQPRSKSTSGSTGVPLVYKASNASHSTTWALNWRAFSVTGFQPGDRIATLSGGALLPAITPLKQKIYMRCMGMVQLPAYHMSEADLASYVRILSNNPDIRYIYAYASAAHLFARYVETHCPGEMTFEAIFTTSEVLAPDARRKIEQAFNTPVYDTYGNNEAALGAFECGQEVGMHYSMETSLLEVLDNDDAPVAEGRVGRFIATNLVNYAMPLIRYDTGDLGSTTRIPCSCGRTLDRITTILGRSRDFIVTPDGRHIHGAFFNNFQPFYDTHWISGWHVLQEDRSHLQITLRPDGTPTEKDMQLIRNELRQALGSEMEISLRLDPRLHTTASGKQKLVECTIPFDETGLP